MEKLLKQYKEALLVHLKNIDFTYVRKHIDIMEIDLLIPDSIDEDDFNDEALNIQQDALNELGIYYSLRPNGEGEYWLKDAGYDSNGHIITSDFQQHYDENDVYYQGDEKGLNLIRQALLNKIVK